MNLTLIISSLQAGGAEKILVALANYWSKEHQVSLVTLSQKETKPFYWLEPKVKLIQLENSYNGANLLIRLWKIITRIYKLRTTIKKTQPQVILSFVDVMNIMTLLAAIKLPNKVVISERTHPQHYKLPKFYQILRNFLYPYAGKIIVQTKDIKEYFKSLANVVIIPNPVLEPKQKKQALTIINNLVAVGRLCPFKGFVTLIKAFAILATFKKELTLTIYGEGKDRENLLKLINDYQLADRIFLVGLTNNVSQELLKFDLFIFPSLYEGFPNALCEAMAVGLPVVVSNCVGNIEIVSDGVDGKLFMVNDVDHLVLVINELINDINLANLLAYNARKICQRFQWDKVLKLWDEALIAG